MRRCRSVLVGCVAIGVLAGSCSASPADRLDAVERAVGAEGLHCDRPTGPRFTRAQLVSTIRATTASVPRPDPDRAARASALRLTRRLPARERFAVDLCDDDDLVVELGYVLCGRGTVTAHLGVSDPSSDDGRAQATRPIPLTGNVGVIGGAALDGTGLLHGRGHSLALVLEAIDGGRVTAGETLGRDSWDLDYSGHSGYLLLDQVRDRWVERVDERLC